ncbi:pyridoxal phosphate-dependent aminotransferase [Marivirga sp.]|uniref:pyridoxal phosphate-dependent aminotransferase n=1 Tax=Marivirga sp. TaxID=2018662 RepID=UPI002D80E1FE|nr:aminotransferase class I/II-fold pyridoxal phosphate-dependent enzyme [Marivirga sp.]HET8859679.1 aminotransferase class I/II-fold pyridoxal phosphate-dependent enzyme [Marivirga sp.]
MVKSANRIQNVKEYYFSKKLQEVKALDTIEKPIINLGIGSPDLQPHPAVIAKLNEVSKLGKSHAYQPYKGTLELREAVTDFYKRIFNVQLDSASEIVPLMGSKEGIMHIMMAFVNEGDEVLLPNPGYPTYAATAEFVGAKISHYDLKEEHNWQIDLVDLKNKINPKVKLMFINTPHMPTGSKLNDSVLQELVKIAKEKHFLLVNDNPYSIILNQEYRSLLNVKGAKEICLELNSMSKSHNMAGWRIGWCMGSSEHIDAIMKVKSNMDSGMFLALQKAAIEALNLDDSWFKNLNEIYQKRQKYAMKIAELLDCSFDSNQSGLFLWAKVPETIKSVEQLIDDILHACKVFICPGFIFGSNGNRYIRIALCADEKNLEVACQRIKEWIETK